MQVMQWPIHAVLRDVPRSAVLRCSRAAWLWFAWGLDSGPSGYCPLDSGSRLGSKSDLVCYKNTHKPLQGMLSAAAALFCVLNAALCWAMRRFAICKTLLNAIGEESNAPGLETASWVNHQPDEQNIGMRNTRHFDRFSKRGSLGILRPLDEDMVCAFQHWHYRYSS